MIIRNYHWRLLIVIAAILISILFIIWIRAVLVPFFLALVLTYLLAPLVDWLEQQGFRRGWAILLIYLMLGVLVAAIIFWLIPDLLQELYRLAETLPDYTRQIQNWFAVLQTNYSRLRLPEALRAAIDHSIAELERQLLLQIEGTITSILGLFNGLFSLILAPVLAFYLLKDLKSIKKRTARLLPAQRRGRWYMLMIQMDRVLSGFIRGQLLLSLFVGVTTWMAMELIGMRFSIMLGIIAAITEVIPYFGPVIGALPAIGLAALVSPYMVIKVIIAYLLIHELDSSVVGPRVLGQTVGLHPLAVVFALLAGGEIYGLIGVILAVPVAACLKVLALFAYDSLTAYRGPISAGR